MTDDEFLALKEKAADQVRRLQDLDERIRELVKESQAVMKEFREAQVSMNKFRGTNINMAEETMVERRQKAELTKDALRCSFCHKTQYAVRSLISSPASEHPRAYICDRCVMVCDTILWDKLDKL